MISKQEIMDSSWEFSLDPNTVEKDYVLGWLLAGINNHSDLFDTLVFKGGTCLKKCYYETFRFSEDLDYTLRYKENMDVRFFTERFRQVAGWIEDAIGIEIPLDAINFEQYKNRVGREAIRGRIGYIGPMQRRRQPARIRLDLTADEILVTEPCMKEVHHPYSDKSLAHAQAYS